MQRRYWAPLIAVIMAILVLVPTTLAKGSAGDTYGAAFGTNRFPGGLNTATINLTFVTNDVVRLDATVRGTDLRSWTIRVYDRGTCQLPTHWVVTRPGTNGSGQSVPLSVFTNQAVSMFLDPADVARLKAVPASRNLAFMFAGAGSGSLNSGSPYRTCAVGALGGAITSTSTSTSTSNTTSTTSANTAACLTTRTIGGIVTTIAGTTQTVGGTATTVGGTTQTISGTLTTIAGTTQTISGTATTIGGTTQTIPGTVTTVGGSTSTIGVTVGTSVVGTTFTVGGTATTIGGTTQTIGGTATTIGGTTQTISGATTSVGGTTQTIGGTATTIGGTLITVTPATTTGLGTLTTVSGTRSSGICSFPQ